MDFLLPRGSDYFSLNRLGPKPPVQYPLYALPEAGSLHRFWYVRCRWAQHGGGSLRDRIPLPRIYRELALTDQIQKGGQLVP